MENMVGANRPGPAPDKAKRIQVVALRANGLSLREIGAALGISKQRAGKLLQSTKKEAK